MLRFALAGNPNCGKTTLFNSLTGSSAYVGNWPGVTVEKRAGKYRKADEEIEVVDLPGIYSLSPYTAEEVVSRNFLLDESPDAIINIVDATNLERNLYLTTQLLEIDVPIILALNMMDVVAKRGDRIDADRLSAALGVPVVEISALRSGGIHELMQVACEYARKPRTGSSVLSGGALGNMVGEISADLKAKGVLNPLFHAIKLIEGDKLEIKAHSELKDTLDEMRRQGRSEVFGDDYEAYVADLRYRYIRSNFSPVIVRKPRDKEMTLSDRIDRVLTSRVWGIPIFLAVMFVVFHLTFSSDFLFLNSLYGVEINWWIFEGVGVPSPGVFLQEALVWCTDSLTALLEGALASSPAWISSLLCNGVCAGVFSVLSFLPQIALMFFFLSILEDSGYMARVAFIMDGLFRRFGLSGKSFMPLLMGFGCSVPAIMASRTLENEKERRMTIYITPWFSCSAKTPIYSAICSAVLGNDLAVYGMYLLGIVCAILGALLLKSTFMRGKTPPFILELPSYHMPQARALGLHVWEKVKKFIIKAATIIAASTIVIWFLSNFDWSYRYLNGDITQSIIHDIGSLISWIFWPLGFSQGEYGWVFVVAAITGLVGKEQVVSTLAVLGVAISGLSGAGQNEAISALFAVAGVNTAAIIAFMAFNLLVIPCFGAIGAARAELGKGKHFNFALLWWVLSAYAVSMVIYLVGTWWWTVFIFAAAAAAAITVIVLYNKGIIKPLARKKEKEDLPEQEGE